MLYTSIHIIFEYFLSLKLFKRLNSISLIFLFFFLIFMHTWLNETTKRICFFRFRGSDIGMNTWCIKIKMQIIFTGYKMKFSFLSLQRSTYPNCRNVYIHDRSTFYNDTSQRDRWMDITNQICSKARCWVSKYMGGGLGHKLCMQMSLSDFFARFFHQFYFLFSLYDCQISTQPVKSYAVRLNLVSKYKNFFFFSIIAISLYALCLTFHAVDLKRKANREKKEWGRMTQWKKFLTRNLQFLATKTLLFCYSFHC